MFKASYPGSRLSLLYISYPLLTVSEDSAGGAEQVLLTLEREMADEGHRTTVAASDGSRVCGRLLATGEKAKKQDAYVERERKHTERILEYLHAHPAEFDLIHDHSGSFFRHAARCPIPVLATLHLPHSFYCDFWFSDLPPNLYFNCVSHSQARHFSGLPNMLEVVPNGIALDGFPFCAVKGDYLLWLGRICEEKAPHLAIEAAREAGTRLVIAGKVYPFRYHQQYFEREIQPRLSSDVQFVDSPTFDKKIELLRRARALLLTSTAEETSSLVAMEAMACGTPVIATRRGAFPEIVADGETGFVVDTIKQVAEAANRLRQISLVACRARVEQCFSANRMAKGYKSLYRRLLFNAQEQVAA